MVPAGYLAKRIAESPAWLNAPQVFDIYSVSGCVSENFADYIDYWQHNGYWLFNSPDIIVRIADEHRISLKRCRLFYYEIYDLQFDEKKVDWESFVPELSFPLDVRVPSGANLEGHDVVSFFAGTNPECSPLSCNGLARDINTNSHCLLETFNEAKHLIESGRFVNCEPGPYRIFSVYTANWP